jgi:hypothetical protein
MISSVKRVLERNFRTTECFIEAKTSYLFKKKRKQETKNIQTMSPKSERTGFIFEAFKEIFIS